MYQNYTLHRNYQSCQSVQWHSARLASEGMLISEYFDETVRVGAMYPVFCTIGVTDESKREVARYLNVLVQERRNVGYYLRYPVIPDGLTQSGQKAMTIKTII